MLEPQLNTCGNGFNGLLYTNSLKCSSPESKCIVGSTSGDVTFLAKFLPLLTSLFNEVGTFLNVNVSGYILWTE